MSTPEPEHRADRRRNRRRLLDAAEAVIEEEGAQASFEKIARRAGVGSATLYRHFPTRQALLNAVFHEGVARLTDRARALHDELGPREALATWLEELTTYTTSTRGLAAALMAGSGGIAVENTCHGLIKSGATLLVAEASATGALRTGVEPGDLIALANAISLASDGDPESARRLLDLALGGILKRPQRTGTPDPELSGQGPPSVIPPWSPGRRCRCIRRCRRRSARCPARR